MKDLFLEAGSEPGETAEVAGLLGPAPNKFKGQGKATSESSDTERAGQAEQSGGICSGFRGLRWQAFVFLMLTLPDGLGSRQRSSLGFFHMLFISNWTKRHVSSLCHSAFHLYDKTPKANNRKKKSLFWLMVLEAIGLGSLVLLCGTYGGQLSKSW